MHIVVLGGGPGGYSAAFEAARAGAQVTLIEREHLGGTCLNWGCVPTKTILRTARIFRDIQLASEFGLRSAHADLDIDALRDRKEGIVDGLRSQIESTAARLKIRVLAGEGRLTGPKTVRVSTPEGSHEDVVGDALILATGSVPFLLPNIDHSLARVWTSDEAVSLVEIPKRVIIIGGGVIGLEFACAYASFGSDVDVVELQPAVMPGNDARVQKAARAALEEMGVTFHLGTSVIAVQDNDDAVAVELADGTVLAADILMSAVGRKPNSAGLGFEDAGIEMDRAAVKVDAHFRSNLPGVYAIGDLIGGMMLAHVADEEGVAAARNAVAELSGSQPTHTMDYQLVPACVYTFPEIAVVGRTRDGAKDAGLDVVQTVAKFAANGKALGEGESDGFVQLVAEKGTGRIVGCQIVGPHAVEIIHEVALAMKASVNVSELAEMCHAHPTVSEVVMLAAAAAAAKV